MAELAKPTTNHHAADPSPEATRAAILRAVAAHPGVTRREASRIVYGTDLVGASRSASAVGWLRNARLIERRGGDRLFVTDAGRAALDLDDVLAQEA